MRDRNALLEHGQIDRAGIELLFSAPSPGARRAVFTGTAVTLLAGSIELGGALRGRSLFLTADAIHLMAHMDIYIAVALNVGVPILALETQTSMRKTLQKLMPDRVSAALAEAPLT